MIAGFVRRTSVIESEALFRQACLATAWIDARQRRKCLGSLEGRLRCIYPIYGGTKSRRHGLKGPGSTVHTLID